MKLDMFCGGMKQEMSSDAEGGMRSPLSVGEELSDGDCVAHSTPPVSPRTGAKSKPNMRRAKPPFSYIALIAMAIRDSSSGRLTLAEINDSLVENFPFFRGSYTGWRNSVRHNLSLNDCFLKVLRDPSRPWGKDNYWMLNPQSEYTFADGVFRRRRKRIEKKCSREPEVSARAEVPKSAHLSAISTKNQSCVKFTSSFAIDSILSTPFKRDSQTPQHPAFTWPCCAELLTRHSNTPASISLVRSPEWTTLSRRQNLDCSLTHCDAIRT